jgi:hypothetical protein
MDPLTQGLIAGVICGILVLAISLPMRAWQKKRPHGTCAYCGNVLALYGPYKLKCPRCKKTQPWAGAGKG